VSFAGDWWSLGVLVGTMVVSLAISAAATALLSAGAIARLHVLDHPNHRSLHERPVPRSGGLAILASLVSFLAAFFLAGGLPPHTLGLGVAVAVVAAVSFLDDRFDVPQAYRLLSQVVAAAILITAGLSWSVMDLPGLQWHWPTPLALLATILYVVWMTNLYNFMDGINGLAGGMAVFGFATLGLLGWQAGDLGFALTATAITAAAAGFLTGNFPSARIFLGDVGSSTLGLLAAALALWGASAGHFPLWVAWLAFSPFIVDATWTLFARLSRGEAVWRPHRSHHYQRLVLAGWSHSRTTLWAYVLMVAAGASAVAAPGLLQAEQWILISLWGLIYGLVHLKVRGLERDAIHDSA